MYSEDKHAAQPRVIVLGLGNILLQDEGLGIRVIERLIERHRLPTNVQAIDGGVMGLDLLPYLEQADALLIIDAIRTGQPPGTIVRLEGEAIPIALAIKMSVHQVGLQELLATSRFQGTLPSRIVLWGMEPASLEWGLDLSPPVAAQVDALVENAVAELAQWGDVLTPR